MLALRFASSKHLVCLQEKCLKLHTARACPPTPFQVILPDAMPDATIHTLGIILENPQHVLYRVSLPNGKIILAHLSKALAASDTCFQVDQRVILELTPYDFDQARILRAAD